MNNAACVEAEDSEFVEVDPTGRYGRVYIYTILTFYSSPLFASLNSHHMFFVLILSFEFHVLQYNEILGKGASKIVYVSYP